MAATRLMQGRLYVTRPNRCVLRVGFSLTDVKQGFEQPGVNTGAGKEVAFGQD